MAEEEVIKHTKKIYKVWNSKEHSVWHKLKEFLVEIFIIVFAVTLSIWLHDRTEHNHQQKEVKEFLLGLKEDLTSDITEMGADIKRYMQSKGAFGYVTSIKMHQNLSMDSIKNFGNFMYNNVGLLPNTGRFEGFKSSGKIGTIENKILQNNIMDLYQENIPSLITTTNFYTIRKNKFADFVQEKQVKITDSTSNIIAILMSDEAQNMCMRLSNVDEIVGRYTICIKKMEKIITAIDEQYKN